MADSSGYDRQAVTKKRAPSPSEIAAATQDAIGRLDQAIRDLIDLRLRSDDNAGRPRPSLAHVERAYDLINFVANALLTGDEEAGERIDLAHAHFFKLSLALQSSKQRLQIVRALEIVADVIGKPGRARRTTEILSESAVAELATLEKPFAQLTASRLAEIIRARPRAGPKPILAEIGVACRAFGWANTEAARTAIGNATKRTKSQLSRNKKVSK